KMSPACFEWPLTQPLMLIEITTYGFVAEPVLWQISTFSPFVFSCPEFPAMLDELLGVPFGFGAEERSAADGLGLDAFAFTAAFAFPSTFAFAGGAGFEASLAPFLWPVAFAC